MTAGENSPLHCCAALTGDDCPRMQAFLSSVRRVPLRARSGQNPLTVVLGNQVRGPRLRARIRARTDASHASYARRATRIRSLVHSRTRTTFHFGFGALSGARSRALRGHRDPGVPQRDDGDVLPMLPFAADDLKLRRETTVLAQRAGELDLTLMPSPTEADLRALHAERALRLVLVDHNRPDGVAAGLDEVRSALQVRGQGGSRQRSVGRDPPPRAVCDRDPGPPRGRRLLRARHRRRAPGCLRRGRWPRHRLHLHPGGRGFPAGRETGARCDGRASVAGCARARAGRRPRPASRAPHRATFPQA